MKKLMAFVLALICALGLFGCNNTAEIEIDKIVMLHSTDREATSEKVTIIDKETISELLAMYNSLQTVAITSPPADERMRVIFYRGDEVEIEWLMSAYGKNLSRAELITWSNLWNEGQYHHAVTSKFDYNRLVEIFDTAKG